jgi:hypothetical protein
MQAVSLVFVPYPVPVGNGVGWEKRTKPAPYPALRPPFDARIVCAKRG